MNKLLLLATSLISLTIPGNADATGAPQPEEYSFQQPKPVPHDSLIKEPTAVRPQEGFKDLFENTTSEEGIGIAKLNPQAISFVQDYMEKHTDNLEKMKDWGRPYFDMMDNVLEKHGLPAELKYLAVIESSLKNRAVSWAGAVGPWQLMPETARLLGLKVSKSRDDRTDFTKSTHAAARYLTQLYGIYNDWLLVIAAYNGGPGNVNTAIRKSGSRNFWKLQYHLPTESRNHVKKFIATHYIMEGEGGLTTLTKTETESMLLMTQAQPAVADASVAALTVSGKYNAGVIAQHLQMSTAEFSRLNPNFDRELSARGSFELKLPTDKMTLFQASKPQILEQSIRLLLSSARG